MLKDGSISKQYACTGQAVPGLSCYKSFRWHLFSTSMKYAASAGENAGGDSVIDLGHPKSSPIIFVSYGMHKP